MSRMSLLSSPLLLGFEDMERLIDRVGKGGDGYPPYNIERIAANGRPTAAAEPVERLRITLAVAGFRRDQLEITVEDNQLEHPRPPGRRQVARSTSTAALPRASSAARSCWLRASR